MHSASETEVNTAVNLIKHEYNRKYADREHLLFFYSSLYMIDDGESAGYKQFCENIGGEVARWALKEKESNVYKNLKNDGEQMIVKLKLTFADIVDFQKEIIVYRFISFFAGKFFWDFEYRIEFDGITKVDILPEKIIELISYDKEVDY